MVSVFGRVFKNTNLKLVTIFILVTLFTKGSIKNIEPYPNGVLLIDALYSGDYFKDELQKICEKNNQVLEIKDENVTVNYFSEISGNYSLVILRLHSTCQRNLTWMFTGEPYSPTKYVLEQLAFEVHSAKPDNTSTNYFVVSSYFIEHYLSGKITSDCVILMGCNGLITTDMGNAWIKAGSNSYISWNGDISLQDTDRYTLKLVDSYFRNGFKEGLVNVLPSIEYKAGNSWLLIHLGNTQ